MNFHAYEYDCIFRHIKMTHRKDPLATVITQKFWAVEE